MRLWFHLSSLLWEERVMDTQQSAAVTDPEAAGLPNFVRNGARLASIGFSAVLLAAQVTGDRLAASVDADPTCCVRPSQLCKAACNGTNPTTGQPETHSQCIQRCNEQREVCERAP